MPPGDPYPYDTAGEASVTAVQSETTTHLTVADRFIEFWDEHRSVLRVVDLATNEGDDRFRPVMVLPRPSARPAPLRLAATAGNPYPG